MNRKVTKSEFEKIFTEAICKEADEIKVSGAGALGGMAIMLAGISIASRVTVELFKEDTDTLEIITDKE